MAASDQKVEVRMTEEQKQTIVKAANLKGEFASGFMRRVSLEEAKEVLKDE